MYKKSATKVGLFLGLISLLLSACTGMHPAITEVGSNHFTAKNKDLHVIKITTQSLIEMLNEQRNEALININNNVFESSRVKTEYKVGPYDVLSIIVWDHPELNNPTNATVSFDQLGFVVNSKGDITYPYVGTLHVAGYDVNQIQHALRARLSKYLVKPVLVVRVLNFNSRHVNVVGEVNKPIIVPITNVPLSVMDGINMAGGVTTNADLKYVTVKRNNQIFNLNLRPNHKIAQVDFLLKDGDTVLVPNYSERQVYVLGEVITPKAYIINKDRFTLSDALAQAGGARPDTSYPRYVFVFRRNQAGEQLAYVLNAASPDALLLANEFPLEAADVVYVSTCKLTDWNRIMLQVVPTALTAAYSGIAYFNFTRR